MKRHDEQSGVVDKDKPPAGLPCAGGGLVHGLVGVSVHCRAFSKQAQGQPLNLSLR